MSGRVARAVRGLTVRDLRVETAAGVPLVAGLDLDVPRGRVVGLVGEAGAGKTAAGLALLGHAARGTRITAGAVQLYGTDVLALPERARRTWRGRRIAYVAPDAGPALDPGRPVGRQVLEALAVHGALGSAPARTDRVAEALAEAGLPAGDGTDPGAGVGADPGADPDVGSDHALLTRRPGELTAVQRQRVALAVAFACRPAAVVLDDPAAVLDPADAAGLLVTVRELARRHGSAVLYLTRDLTTAADVADELAVLYAGGLVETGTVGDLVRSPRHPYTAALVASVPDPDGRRELRGLPGSAPEPARRPMGCRFAPRCRFRGPECVLRLPELVEVGPGHRARCVHHDRVAPTTVAWDGEVATGRRGARLLGVTGMAPSRTGGAGPGPDLDVEAGSCLVLLGEADAGGPDLVEALAGLRSPAGGTLTLYGRPVSWSAAARTPAERRAIGTWVADTATALDPRRTVGAAVARPLAGPVRDGVPAAEVREKVATALARAGLDAETAAAYPARLPVAGRLQASLARALVTDPAVLVAVEPARDLPATAVAALVRRVTRLRTVGGLTVVVATRDVALARHLATHVAVLRDGQVVEHGPAGRLLTAPADPYARSLLAAVPSLALA